ncbi:hypothetical protein G7046_g1516 [Stylonectria norvegica]|nr:hypothetical protein G7046_g1516 [Stylonectria norvegica]
MDQPVGPLVSPTAAITPHREPLHGRYTSLVPLESSHAKELFVHLGGEEHGHLWTYMFSGPYLDGNEWQSFIDRSTHSEDPLYFTVFSGPETDPEAKPVGMMSYLSIVPGHRRIEIGSVILGESLKRTRAATEAFYLLMNHAFEALGNLRVEWKANHFNKPSLSAAERLGFVYEGLFRNHMIVKDRRRDTSWYSITDNEWPVVKGGLEAWLSEGNFDQNGRQIQGLRELRDAFKAESST